MRTHPTFLWLHHARPAAARLAQEGPLDAALSPQDQLSQLNVLIQLEHVMSYPIVRQQVAAGALRLTGWWFEIGNGHMYTYERASRSFVVIDRQSASRLLGLPSA